MATILTGSPEVNLREPHGVTSCLTCGLVQRLPAPESSHVALDCARCGAPLERLTGRGISASLALSCSALLLLIPANLLPLLKVNIFGVEHQSLVVSGIWGITQQGWPIIGIILALELMVLPFLRFGLLTLVLFGVWQRGEPHPSLGRWFRWSERLDQWAMPDVFLIGCLIGYGRVAPFLPISVGIGGWCVVAVAFLTLLTRSSLERREIWRRIGPWHQHAPAEAALGCSACGLVHSHGARGTPCVRCGETLEPYRERSWNQALALTLAGFFCYPFAYLYPMESNYQLGSLHGYSIMTGVDKLLQAHFYVFALIIFIASVATPFLKLFGLSWFLFSVHYHSTSRLRLKSRLYRMIQQIGRWSHIDVFTVAVFLPLMHLSGLLAVYVGKALPFFLAVVILTMIAAERFDPRLLWRAVDAPAHG